LNWTQDWKRKITPTRNRAARLRCVQHREILRIPARIENSLAGENQIHASALPQLAVLSPLRIFAGAAAVGE
jgi:hypothetical protein